MRRKRTSRHHPESSRITVRIAALGPVVRGLDLDALADALTARQDVYTFRTVDAVPNLPAPTEIDLSIGSRAPFYSADALFAFVRKSAAAEALATGELVCAIVDHPLSAGLFSTVDRDNEMILVSTQVATLDEFLEAAHRSVDQYAAHEIAAELLTIRFRRLAGVSAAPEECAAPWHIESRGCLFDYFGIRPWRPTKLTSPKLCDVSRGELTGAGVPVRQVEATMAIAEYARTVSRTALGKALREDSLILLAFGAFLGLLGAVAAVASVAVPVVFGCLVVLALIVRAEQVRRGR